MKDVEVDLNVSLNLFENDTLSTTEASDDKIFTTTTEIFPSEVTTDNAIVTSSIKNDSDEITPEITTEAYQTIVESSSSINGYGGESIGNLENIYFTTSEPIIEFQQPVNPILYSFPSPQVAAWSGTFRPSKPDYIEENLLALFHPMVQRL